MTTPPRHPGDQSGNQSGNQSGSQSGSQPGADWSLPTWQNPGRSGDGQQYGAPADPQYGQQYGQQYGAPGGQYGRQHGAPGGQYGQPEWPTPGPDGPRRRSRRTLVAVVATVVVLLVVGGGVWLLRRDSGSHHGAASPQDAVSAIVSAALKQDVNGVLAHVDPAESRFLKPFVSDVRSKISKGGMIRAMGVPVPAVSLSVQGLTTSTEQDTKDLAFVTVTGGTGRVTVDPAELPAGQRQNASGGTRTVDLAQALRSVRLGMVRVDGGWYFSPTTTAFEAARVSAGLPMPDFDKPLAEGGGDTPEAAVRDAVRDATTNRLADAAGYLSAKELPALRYYYPVLTARLDPSQTQSDVTVEDLQLSTSDLSNGLKKVTVESLTAKGPDGTTTYRNGCIDSPDGEQQCLGRVNGLLGAVPDAKPFVVVEKNDGRWQIAPLATVVESLREIVEQGSVNRIYRALHAYELAPTTATVPVGVATSVSLNDGGFARVKVTGAAGTCIDPELSDELYLEPLGAVDYDESCYGVLVPASGSVDAVVESSSRSAHTVTVTIQKQ